jgi:tRNA1Val (adenine37-N6)-methyltransferase
MMGSQPFHFKQFKVAQNQCTHKVGTDGVLLSAWVQIKEEDRNILDMGTGSGLIALMLAQRSGPAIRIDAVEIEAQDAQQARENVQHSPWPEKISIHQVPVQQFSPARQYDLIISNPPYFLNSWLPPEKKRSQARHAQRLSFEDLLLAATRLLTKQGRLAVILPYVEALKFINLARSFHLFPIRKTNFRSRAHKPVERLLFELAYDGKQEAESELILYSEGENWSEEYKKLTREFYLKR